ncbi:MAG: hypothetical protein ACREPB_13430 [Arenimonas sp.]
MSDWNDLFVRTDISERSPVGRVGGLSSPDIIPAGITPTNPSKYTTPESYTGFASNEPFQQGQINYVYVRAKNSAASTDAVGVASLVLTNPAVVIWPGGDGWTQIQTNNKKNTSALQPSPTAGGAIAVTTDPFVYMPTDTGHRCIVTWLSTKSHPVPNPPPRITSTSELVKFLQENPNYAHHNIDIVPSTTGAVSTSKPFSAGTVPFAWRFGLQVTNCKGFTVYFSSGTPLPNGQYLSLAPTTVSQDSTVAYMLPSTDLPANWDTYFNYTYETNNLQPANFDVQFVAYADVGSDSEFWEIAKPYDQFFEDKSLAPIDRRGIALGSIGLMKGVK